MVIIHRFPTAYGPALCSEPVLRTIPSEPAAALLFASRVDREADAHLAEGRVVVAEKLAHLALEARCRATGARA